MEMEARLILIKQATIWMKNLDRTDDMLWHKYIGIDNEKKRDKVSYC